MQEKVKDKAGETGFVRVKENVYLLRVPHGGTTTNVVLLTGRENILIDAGGNADEVDTVLLPALSGLSLSLSDIAYLIPTHTHADHIGGFARLRECGICRIVAYEKSLPKIEDPTFYNAEIRRAFPENSPPTTAGLRGTKVDVSLPDGAVIGDRLLIAATPGHDDDTVCLYDGLTRTLVCGDSVQENGTLVQGCGAYMDLPAYRHSLQKLLQLPAQTAVLGHPFLPHGDVIDGEENVRTFLEGAQALTDTYGAFIRGVWESGEHDPVKIAERLIEKIGGVRPAYMFLPLFTVREHLKEIEKTK